MVDKIHRRINTFDIALLIAALIPIIGILPTFGQGLANGADAPFHAHRMYALAELIQGGHFYPRWVNYFHMGYGYPVFNFYAPLSTHIGAWLHVVGFDVATAYNLTNALVWSIGSVGIYLLARLFLPIRIAFLACVLWAYAPSRFYEFWWQGSIAQSVATSFVPFVFYGIARTSKFPTLRNSLWIAIPFSLIVLSHTPTTYMSAIFIAPCCFLLPLMYKTPMEIIRRWVYLLAGLGLSAGLSAIFLLPVFAEVEFVRIAGELPDTVEFLRAGFATFTEIFSIPSIIDSTDVTLIMPRTLGLVGGLLSLFGVIVLIYRRKILMALLLIAGLGFAIFLALELSLDLWLLIPSFRNLRFPERILRIGAIFVAVLGASSLLFVPFRWRSFFVFAVSCFVIVQALPMMHPRDDDRVWENLSALDEIMMEHRENNWGTTAYDEYEPKWGEIPRFDMPHDAETYIDEPFKIRLFEPDYLKVTDKISYVHLSDNEIRVNVSVNSLDMRFRQSYFPGWEAWLNDESIDIQPDERFGLIELQLPEGEHVVRFEYVGTTIQHLATMITIASAIACFVILVRSPDSTLAMHSETDSNISRRFTVFIMGSLIVFAVINDLWLQDAVFRIESPADDPHYMQQSFDVTFDDAVTLLGYTLDADTISDNDRLGIRLYWSLADAADTEYRPIVQLVNLQVNDAWAVSQPLEFEGGKLVDIDENRFMSDKHQLRLFNNVPPYVAQISVQLAASDGTLATMPDGSDRLLLPDIITIDTPIISYSGQSDKFQFGDILLLQCLSAQLGDQEYEVDLIWSVKQTPQIDYQLFVHGLDDNGKIVEQVDIAPLNGLYPLSFWRPNQTLYDHVKLPFNEAITMISVGLYNPADVTRVPVKFSDGQKTDNAIARFEGEQCLP